MRSPRSRLFATLAVALFAWAAVGPASAWAGKVAGLGCRDIPASAIDQYCDSIPTPSGTQAPSYNELKLGARLPAPILRAVLRTSARRKLTGLPAASRSGPVSGPKPQVSVTSAALPLIWVLVGAFVLLLVLAGARRYRAARGQH
jgi:hypothetical protein